MISELLIPELKQEVALTEKFLKRVPADKWEWQPHEKSMTVKQLASHLAEIPSWVNGTMELDRLDMANYTPPAHKNMQEVLTQLKTAGDSAVKCLEACDDGDYDKNWAMVQEGNTLMQGKKYPILRSMVFNQIPHHRAQLGVYLRLMGESVPASYGPSADEAG